MVYSGKSQSKMDYDWWYPYFRKPPYGKDDWCFQKNPTNLQFLRWTRNLPGISWIFPICRWLWTLFVFPPTYERRSNKAVWRLPDLILQVEQAEATAPKVLADPSSWVESQGYLPPRPRSPSHKMSSTNLRSAIVEVKQIGHTLEMWNYQPRSIFVGQVETDVTFCWSYEA